MVKKQDFAELNDSIIRESVTFKMVNREYTDKFQTQEQNIKELETLLLKQTEKYEKVKEELKLVELECKR